jgi:hypothetical protein
MAADCACGAAAFHTRSSSSSGVVVPCGDCLPRQQALPPAILGCVQLQSHFSKITFASMCAAIAWDNG